ncbi:MAG: Omp28-related outer membrane protein [Bacteroidales bacterium]|nr:Omp28-related outer membrane protein [Bacteroidales bacterium]
MRFRNIIIAIMMALLATVVSCQPNIFPDDELNGVKVIAAEGEVSKITFTAENNWSVYNSNDWISVSPMGGIAGEGTLTVNVSANKSMDAREGAIYVLDGASTLMFKLSQGCLDIITTDHREYYVPESGQFTMLVKSTVPFDVAPSVDWITCTSGTHYDGGSKDLAISFNLSDNTGSNKRSGEIVLSADGGISTSVEVTQAAHVEIDWNKTFYKSVLGYRFTGDWCGYCPNLEYDIAKFSKDQPGRFNYISIYDASSTGKLSYSASSRYETRFNVSGKPTIVLDERGLATSLSSPGYYDVIKAFCAEEVASYPSETCISAYSSIIDDKVSVHPVVYAKQAGTYHIHVVLLENGIVAKQTDYTGLYTDAQLNKFVHDNVVRAHATKLLTGDEFTVGAKESQMFNFSIEIPKTVQDKKNLA